MRFPSNGCVRMSNDTKEHTMHSDYEGLPAAGSVEQAITLAQLRILRQLERQRQVR